VRHIWPFLKYWNRPLENGWARDFRINFIRLAGLSLFGPVWTLLGEGWFFATVVAWTIVSVREYRRSGGAGKQGGDRFRVYDRNDIWGGRWPF
jgi:hypothetical protein